MRAVLDPNVLISSALAPEGTPAQLLRAWQQGGFELVVSELLLAELERALAYPKLRSRVEPVEAAAFVAWLRSSATLAADPAEPPPVRSPDPADDYLIAQAASARAVLVSGDQHLLGLATAAPILSPAQLAATIDDQPGPGSSS